MYYSSIYHARKSILNYDFQSDQRKLNIKNFIYNCRNYLYLERGKNPSLEQALCVLRKKNKEVARALEECIELKKSNYAGLTQNFDIKILRLSEDLFAEYVNALKNEWFFEFSD